MYGNQLRNRCRCGGRGARGAPVGARRGRMGTPLALLLSVLVLLAALLVAGVIYLSSSAVEIVVRNEGCEPIAVPRVLPVDVPGLVLPAGSIPPGGQTTAKVPGITLDWDAASRDAVSLRVLGVRIAIDLGPQYTSLKLDGAELLGTRSTIALGSRGRHDLVIACR